MVRPGRDLSRQFQSSHDHKDINEVLVVLQETVSHIATDDQRLVCLDWLTQSLVLYLEDLGGDDHHGKQHKKH